MLTTESESSSRSPSPESNFVQRKLRKHRKRLRKQIRKLARQNRLSKSSSAALQAKICGHRAERFASRELAQALVRRLTSAEMDNSKSLVEYLRVKDLKVGGVCTEESAASFRVGNRMGWETDISNGHIQNENRNLKNQGFMGRQNLEQRRTQKLRERSRKLNQMVEKMARSVDLILEVVDVRDPVSGRLADLKKQIQ